MNWKTKLAFLLVMLVVLSACQTSSKKESKQTADNLNPILLQHATGFELWQADNYKLLKIYNVGGDKTHFESFKLVEADQLSNVSGENIIPVPCKRIICLSSTQLTYFFGLNDIENIVATNSSRHLFHKGMNERIQSGLVKKVGKEGHFNTELIASLNPDIIFVSPFKIGGFDALRSLGFPLVSMAAYDEETPLGRAEWVKMIASFIQKETMADSIFGDLASRYDSLKQLTATVKHRPSVFSGKMRSGTWYVPGGDSFYAHYFRDAGAEYIIKNDRKAAYPVDFETIYTQAANCDFWRILVPEAIGFNRQALLAEDLRYSDFEAFNTGNIFICNIREKPYYEQNAMRPDVILSDYIHFFHPDLLPGYSPVFYEYLN